MSGSGFEASDGLPPGQDSAEDALLEEIEVILGITKAINERAGEDASREEQLAAAEEMLREGGEFVQLVDRLGALEDAGRANVLAGIDARAKGDEEAARRYPRISVWTPPR